MKKRVIHVPKILAKLWTVEQGFFLFDTNYKIVIYSYYNMINEMSTQNRHKLQICKIYQQGVS